MLGINYFGQLGNRDPRRIVNSPSDVMEPANDFIDVKAGIPITCARTKIGGVKCWGKPRSHSG